MQSKSLALGVCLLLLSACPLWGQESQPRLLVTLGSAANWAVSPYMVALSRDGKQLAYRNGPETIALVEPLTGKLVRTIPVQEKEIGERLYYSPDGQHLIFHAMPRVTLVDASNGKVIKSVGNPADFYSHDFRWNTDFTRLISVEQNFHFDNKPKVKIWDGGTLTGEIDIAPNGGGRCEAISGNGKLIATSARYHKKAKENEENVEEYVELWDFASRQRKGRVHLGKDVYAVSLALNADGKYLVAMTETQDGTVLWDTSTNQKVATLGRIHYGPITFSADGKLFAVQSIGGATLVFETATGNKVADFAIKGSTLPAGVGFSSEGDIVAAYAKESQIEIGVVNKKEQLPTTERVGHSRPVVLTRFSDDGKSLLSVGRDLRILRWSLETGKLLETVIDDSVRVTLGLGAEKAAISPDGNLVVALQSGSLLLYNLANKKKVADLQTKNPKYFTRFSEFSFTTDARKVVARGEGQEKTRKGFDFIVVGYAAAWNTQDGEMISEYSGGKHGGEELLEKHFANERLSPAPAAPGSAPLVEVGPVIRDPWASSHNAGPISVGHKLTLTDPATKKVILDRVLGLSGDRGISFSPDGKKIALPMLDGTVQILALP